VTDRTVTDEAACAAAKALYDRLHAFVSIPARRAWEDSHPDEQQQWRDDVAPVLAAAAPVMFAALADEWDDIRRIGGTPQRELSILEIERYSLVRRAVEPDGVRESMTKFDFAAWVRSAAGRWQPDA
jgi:hypothetical protein